MSAEVPAAAESSRWQWLVRLLFRRIWFRAALFSASAVALALLAAVVTPFIPYDISAKIGADAVDNILGILASSMLAVTTFSLTAMVSAFSGANSTITPRATQLITSGPLLLCVPCRGELGSLRSALLMALAQAYDVLARRGPCRGTDKG